MSWRDLLEPASFRGVGFFVESNDMSTGRRVAVHEYPKRDIPYAEDMGAATRAITFDAYVLGSDYVAAKNALLDALETAGPGELVHPLYGVRNVQAGACSVRETKQEGGMARFSLEFTETGESLHPVATTDAIESVGITADSSIESSETAFLNSFSVDGLPQWGVQNAIDLVSDASDLLADAFAPLKASAEQMAKLNQDIIRLKDEANSLVRAPEELADLMKTTFGSIATSDATASSGVTALLAFYNGYVTSGSPGTTPTKTIVERNRISTEQFFRQLALVEAVRIAPLQEFGSREEAETQRDELGDFLDDQSEDADDDVYNNLSALRSEMVQAIPDENARLPEIVTVSLNETTPAVVLAYRLYADASRDQEIIDRNNVQNPGFVPGGVPIEVLTDE